MKSLFSAAIAATVAFGSVVASAPAKAVQFDVTVTGTLGSGSIDYGGIFGDPGSDLATKSVVMTMRLDSSLGSGIVSSPPTQYLSGGVFYGTTSPLVSAVVTVGSTSFALGSFDLEGYAEGTFAPDISRYFINGISLAGNISADVTSYTNTFGGPNLYTPFPSPYNTASGDYLSASFQLLDPDTNQFTYGNFNPATLTVESVSEVPLPAALPLFASALLSGGVIAWRKRRKQKAEPIAA